VNLDFGYCGMKDSNFEALSKVLKGLKYLEAVRVDFSGFDINDAELHFLSEIGKGLKTFEAKFSSCPKMTDIGLKSLDLREFVSLQALSIRFWSCDQITDEGLGSFSDGLGQLVLFENLEINFGYCSKITDKGFISLCEAFEKLILLQDLQLPFPDCPGITHQGGRKLCESLKNFGSGLKRIYWHFYRCDLLSERELSILYENLKNCHQNRSLVLSGQRYIRETICHLAEQGRDLAGDHEREREEGAKKSQNNKGRFGGFKERLFRCFMKKRNGKQKDLGIMMNNKL